MSRKNKRRNKQYSPRQVKGNMLVASSIILEPLNVLLRNLSKFHLVDVEGDEPFVFLSDGKVVMVIPYLDVIIDMAKKVSTKKVEFPALQKFINTKLDSQSVTYDDVQEALREEKLLKRLFANLDPRVGQDFVVTTKIKREFDNLGLTEN